MSRQQSQPVKRTRQSIGGTTRHGERMAAPQLPRTRRPADRCASARLHARQLVWEWALDGLAETAELLVSELATNAVQAMARQEGHTAVRLQLFGDNTRVRIEVWDADLGRRLPEIPERTAYPTSKAREGAGCSW